MFWAIVTTLLSAAAIYHWLWDVTVLDYGGKDDTYFDVREASPGQRVNIWFDGVTWYRTWPSVLHVKVKCNVIDPLDSKSVIVGQLNLEPHVIDVPLQTGKLERKHRAFIVPPECLPGKLSWNAEADSVGFPFWYMDVRRAYPPELHLIVKQ